MEINNIVIGLVVISVVLAVISLMLWARLVSLKAQLMAKQAELDFFHKQSQEKTDFVEQAEQRLQLKFKDMANDLLEDKSKRFTEQNKTNLEGLLNPLSEKIKSFEKKVDEAYEKETKERYSLITEIAKLRDLNNRMSTEAINLTNALKGQTKTQGTWGEVILERVLENSGLHKGREYELQVSLTNDDGKRYQPDAIVHLPDNKDVIIDAKVSLVAYERFCSADNDEEKEAALKAHVLSVRSHMKELGGKDYQTLTNIRTLDFVLMFVPIEAAVNLVSSDLSLMDEAFSKKIVLVSPSTLLATLRIIENIWRYEQQNQNALVIAKQAGDLYDKFVGFVEDLDSVGSRLQQTQDAYDSAYKKLSTGRGNLINRAEGIKKLGAKTSKNLSNNLLNDAEDESETI
jgi:DNA recombination protein RmuC